MKVLIYCSSFYPNIGGIELLTYNLARAFQSLNHEVIVLTHTMQESESTDVKIVSFPTLNQYIKYYKWCDVFYMPNISLKISWLLLINPFKKWVISHNTWYFDPEHPNYLVSAIKQILLFKATNISVSHVLSKSIWAKSTVIHNCFDNKIFVNNKINRDKDFLFVGRLVSSKGVTDLVIAFKQVLHAFPESKLTIVGNGPEEISIKNKVYELGITDSIIFLGPKSQIEIASIMNNHKCLVVPSVGTEAFGIVVLEALACGCKVISSNSTGLVEAGDLFSIRFPAADINNLAAKMTQLIELNFETNYNEQELATYLSLHHVHNVANRYLALFN